MAEKTIEALTEEIINLEEKVLQAERANKKLKTELEKATTHDKTIAYIQKLATEYEVAFNINESSNEYWKEILDKAVLAIYEEAKGAIEELEEGIVKRDVQIELQKQHFIDLNSQIEALEKEIKVVSQKSTSEINRLTKLVAERDELKKKLAETNNKLRELNKSHNKIYRTQTNAVKQAEEYQALLREEIVRAEALEVKISKLEEKLGLVKEAVSTLTPDAIYATVASMIIKHFNKAGYKVSPYSATENNSKENNREYELYKAVKKARKEDKKAESKTDDYNMIPDYTEKGYSWIVADIVLAYNVMKEGFSKADLKVFEEFEKQYAVDQNKDGVINAEEVIETIIEKEQSKGGFIGFIKTTQGKVLSLAAAVVIAGALIFGGTQANQAYNANQEVNNLNEIVVEQDQEIDDWSDKYDTVVGERDDAIADKETAEQEKENAETEKEKAEADRNQAIVDKETAEQERDEAREELAGKDEEIQNIIAGYISGDIVTLDTQSAQFNKEFASNESYLEAILANDVTRISTCQYNKETGDATIVLKSLENGKEITTSLSFTIDMANISQAIKDGKTILDFSTVIDEIKKNPIGVKKTTYSDVIESEIKGPNDSMSTSQSTVEKVYVSFKTSKTNKQISITCVVMIESIDENGNTTITTRTSNPYVYNSNVNVEKAEEKVKEAFLNELGIVLDEEEIEMQ